MERPKPATRTVASRRVYGKRRNNAARAVFFDHQSPSRGSPLSAKDVNVRVEVIETKLGKVTLNDVATEPDVRSNCTLTPTPAAKAPKRHSTSKIKSSAKLPPSVHLPSPSSSLHKPPRNIPQQPKSSAIESKSTSMIDLPCATAGTVPFVLHVDEDDSASIIPTHPIERKVAEVTAALASQFVTDTEADHQPISNEDPPTRSIRTIKSQARETEVHAFVQDPKINDYVRPILDLASSRYSAFKAQSFAKWGSSHADMFTIVKLAEGSYGEVYQLKFREDRANTVLSNTRLKRLRKLGTGILKVVPLRARSGTGSRSFTTIKEIVSELKLLKYLDPIPGFARFRAVDVVQGRFPEPFQVAWENYKHKHGDECFNPNPANKKAYADKQLWAIIEMENAGCELEKFSCTSIFQVYDIFWGVAMSLARAEEYAEFEHRDLHLGNICIRPKRADGSMNAPTFHEIADWTLNGQESNRMSPSGFGISGLETTMIDYTLSRAVIRDDPNDLQGPFEIASTDLDVKELFESIGEDEDEILLRDTYRFMRACMYAGDPSQTEMTPSIRDIWAEYCPRINLVWLLFILKTLMKKVVPTGLTKEEHNDFTKQFSPQAMELHEKTVRVTAEFERRLNSVIALLDFKTGHKDIWCASDLVAYALDSKWLVPQDFF